MHLSEGQRRLEQRLPRAKEEEKREISEDHLIENLIICDLTCAQITFIAAIDTVLLPVTHLGQR